MLELKELFLERLTRRDLDPHIQTTCWDVADKYNDGEFIPPMAVVGMYHHDYATPIELTIDATPVPTTGLILKKSIRSQRTKFLMSFVATSKVEMGRDN